MKRVLLQSSCTRIWSLKRSANSKWLENELQNSLWQLQSRMNSRNSGGRSSPLMSNGLWGWGIPKCLITRWKCFLLSRISCFFEVRQSFDSSEIGGRKVQFNEQIRRISWSDSASFKIDEYFRSIYCWSLEIKFVANEGERESEKGSGKKVKWQYCRGHNADLLSRSSLPGSQSWDWPSSPKSCIFVKCICTVLSSSVGASSEICTTFIDSRFVAAIEPKRPTSLDVIDSFNNLKCLNEVPDRQPLECI